MFNKSSLSVGVKGRLYGLSAQVLWGTGGIAIKLIDRALPGTLLVGLRHGIGAIVLGLRIAQGRKPVLKNLPWLHLFLIAALAVIPDIILIEAVRSAGAIVAVMIIRLEIPLIVVFAHILLKEKVTKKVYIAAGLSFIGACLISIKPGESLNLDNKFYYGVFLAFIGAIVWALTGVYAKFLLNRQVDPLALSFTRLGIGSILMFILAITVLSNPLQTIINLALADWALIIYLGIFLSGLAYLMFYKSMKLIDAHVASIFLSVSMAVLLVLGLAIGEQVSLIQWGGIALIALSVYMVRSKEPG